MEMLLEENRCLQERLQSVEGKCRMLNFQIRNLFQQSFIENSNCSSYTNIDLEKQTWQSPSTSHTSCVNSSFDLSSENMDSIRPYFTNSKVYDGLGCGTSGHGADIRNKSYILSSGSLCHDTEVPSFLNNTSISSSQWQSDFIDYFDTDHIDLDDCTLDGSSSFTDTTLSIDIPTDMPPIEQAELYLEPYHCTDEFSTGSQNTSIDLSTPVESYPSCEEAELRIYDDILTLTPEREGIRDDTIRLSAGSFRLLVEPLPPKEFKQGFNTCPPLGVLDTYIQALGDYLKSGEIGMKLTEEVLSTAGTQGVLWVVREAWPEAEYCWKLTATFQGFLQVETWRNFPCANTYYALHPAYRPTPTQLSTPHSAIIDWLPWPGIRDRLIMCQEETDVDMVCKTAIQNVIAHRCNELEQRSKHSQVTESSLTAVTSFRVWDLCLLEEQANKSSRRSASQDLVCKPKSASVQALEKAYGLEYNNFLTQKLHPQFFEQYPSLYCDSAVSKYKVRDFPSIQGSYHDVGRPRRLSNQAKTRLSRKIRYEICTKLKKSRER